MAAGDEYRIKAAEFHAYALTENNPKIRAEFENLARAYLRLAEQAQRNEQFDISYEPTPPKLDDPR